jgi:tape measure domain-containing protein
LANFANLTAQLNLNIQNFAQNMQKAATLANKFASNLQGKINTGMVDPTKKAKFEFKDVSRIVQGIIVSKIFYSSLNAIRRATDAVWEFSKELEYAKMVYSNLFGDTELAQEFINVLKDFAAVTPFSFKQSEEAAKRLLAYGIESKNVMFMMQGVLSAATVQGTDAVIEPISRAMGQIYTKGRLMNEEMRQLAEAGIPVYEILQEKLNLTAEELKNLGRTAIPASTALNALVEGINERFGSTLKFASSTTQGIISNIVDNSTMLFAGIFEPFTKYLRGALGRFGEFINELRSIYELKGIGGVFERLIPPALQQDIKVLIANLKILLDIIKSNLASAFKLLGSLLKGLLYAFNALAPAIYTIIGTLAGLLKIITSNEKLMNGLTTAILAAAAAWAVYKLQVVAASIATVVIKGIVKAINALVIAMNFVVYHPIWALLALGVGIFIALTSASDKFRNSINKLFSGFTKLSGMDPNKMLLPDSKSRASDLNKFNEALSDTSKSMDDAAKAAAKAGKNIMSFDEVFTIDQAKNSEDASTDTSTDIPDVAGAFKNFEMPDIDMELPDVGGIATNFVDNLIEALGGKDKLLGAGIGSLLGAALGDIIGGPIGAKIGGILGAIAGWFWGDLARQLGLTDVGTVALPIATVLGAAIGFIAGGPLGAVVGAAIGILVGWIIDSISRGIEEGDWSKIGLPVGIGLGTAIGLIAGGPLGAVVGAAIGGLVGWITDMFIEGFSTGNWDVSGIALGLGTGLGAAIGMIFGGPVGAIIGAAIGALIGWLVGLISDNWGAITDWFKQAWTDIGEFFQKILGTITEKLSGAWDSVKEFFQNIWDTITEKLSGAWDSVKEFFQNIWDTITEKLSGAWDSVKEFFQKIWDTITEKLSGALDSVKEFFQKIWDTITEKLSGALDSVKEFFQKIWDTITEKLSGAWDSVKEFFQKIWDTITEKLSGALDSVKEFFQNIWDTITEKLSGAWDSVKELFQNIWDTITEKLSGAWNSVKEFFQKIWDTITEKLSGAWNSVKEFFQKIWDTIIEKLGGALSSVTKFFSDMYDTVKNKITGMYDSINSGISNIYQSFKNWISDMWSNVFGKLFGWIDSAISKLKDFFSLNSKAKNTDISYANTGGSTVTVTKGHAVGGVFNREHIAKFAEGNKAEAIIPLENEAAMKPFVDAVSNGLTSALMPLIANISVGQQSQLQPLYVGTLIADDRGLKELNRKMNIIQLEEKARRG